MKIFEIITEAPRRNEELIQKVKDLWDSGIRSHAQMAAELGTNEDQVASILKRYYPDRPGKIEKLSPELIQKVKDLWDSGMTSVTKIAAELGTNKMQIDNILTKYYPDRPGKMEKLSPELIQQVKDLWNSGITSSAQMAAELGTSKDQVASILAYHYPGRPGKIEKLSPELIQQVKDLWDRGITSSAQMAAELGTNRDQVAFILKRYYPDRPSKIEKSSVPQELIPSVISMYKTGQGPATIIKLLDLTVTNGGIYSILRKLPNWEEIKAEHFANRQARKQKVATTDIYRPGTIGNKRSKGYGSRHTAGVNWPKYG